MSDMDWRIPLPRLRAINPVPAVHDRQQVYFLQDPQQLSETSLLIPQELGAIFMLCDGTRTLQAIQSSLRSIFGIQMSQEELKELFLALDQAYLLDNKNYLDAYTAAQKAFREAPFRPATHAGVSYPADPDELLQYLQRFGEDTAENANGASIRGLISPHIDFARGGSTYARTWNALKSVANDIELAIILGTDHQGGGEMFTLTRQDYATPFGVLPTYQPGVDLLVDIFGEQASFSGELRHRSEHSIEFASVWLHYIRDGEPCPTLPVLCDALPIENDDDATHPGSDSKLNEAVAELRNLIKEKKTLIVAAGDLSHVGPAFEGKPVQGAGLEHLSRTDHTYIDILKQGDAGEFHRMILANGNHTNVCGTAPFVHTLQILAPVSGALLGYQQCRADAYDTSWVSICGMHLF